MLACVFALICILLKLSTIKEMIDSVPWMALITVGGMGTFISVCNKLGLVDTYWPFYLQGLLSVNSFFVFMLIQFIRGLPRELDESAYLDGCSDLKVFVKILVPLMKPALFSAGLFQFMWTYNDYTNVLIYINSVKKYTLSLALRLSLDAESVVQWNKVMAMSFLSILPLIILFFAAQKYFVEGIATSGLKG